MPLLCARPVLSPACPSTSRLSPPSTRISSRRLYLGFPAAPVALVSACRAGNSAWQLCHYQLGYVFRAAQVLQQVLPQIQDAHPLLAARPAPGRSSSPTAAPARRDRHLRCAPPGAHPCRHSLRSPLHGSPVCSPIRTRTVTSSGQAWSWSLCWASTAASDRLGRAWKDEEERIPLRVHLLPVPAGKTSRRMRWCSASRLAYFSRRRSSSRVEPSMSVNRKVTVPLGKSIVSKFSLDL